MKKAFIYSIKHSIPVFIGFTPVALAYGVLMVSAGYNFIWTGATSIIVLAGSLQFLMVSFFAGGVSIGTIIVMALLLNSRHIFYGIPFIEKFRKFKGWKYYLIYTLADEIFSLHCSHDFGPDVDEKKAYICTAFVVSQYWIIMTIIGALIGSLIKFDTSGIDFAMTALFIVILLDQLKDAPVKLPAAIAFVSSLACLIIIGADSFILPSLLITVAVLIVMKNIIGSRLSVSDDTTIHDEPVADPDTEETISSDLSFKETAQVGTGLKEMIPADLITAKPDKQTIEGTETEK